MLNRVGQYSIAGHKPRARRSTASEKNSGVEYYRTIASTRTGASGEFFVF